MHDHHHGHRHGHRPEGSHDHGHAHDHGQDHDHGHAHGLGHSHALASFGRAFAVGISLNLAFVGIEWVYGAWSKSLALMADAGHNLSDVLGLVLAWVAVVLATRRPCGRFTYGLGRSSILAAMLNALLLFVAVGALGWEAIKRLAAPPPVATGTVMVVAAIGILVNGCTALLFMGGRKTDLNLRGAFLHMALDALVSLGVVVAGLLVRKTGWFWLDPAVSLAIGILILMGGWGLLKEATRLILDGVPEGLEVAEVEAHLRADARVLDVHDLHIWALSTTGIALSAHLRVPADLAPDAFLQETARELEAHFGIKHVTLQLEHGDAGEACTGGCGHPAQKA